jgi:hypothetical protein
MDREGIQTGRGGAVVRGRGACSWVGGGRCRPRELEGGGRGGRSLRAVV